MCQILPSFVTESVSKSLLLARPAAHLNAGRVLKEMHLKQGKPEQAGQRASIPSPKPLNTPTPTSLATQELHANSSPAQPKGASSGELAFFFPWGHGMPKRQGQI